MDKKIIVNYKESGIVEKLAEHILSLLSAERRCNYCPIIVLCIGSDRYTGDALGPLLGSYLRENSGFIVYGCLDTPVHAGNLVETVRSIRMQYRHPFVIAVDACLGKASEVGNIEVWEGSLEAGIAVGHKLPRVGDMSIVGVVNAGGFYGYIDLQTTSLSIVVKLSKNYRRGDCKGAGMLYRQRCCGRAQRRKTNGETTYPT